MTPPPHKTISHRCDWRFCRSDELSRHLRSHRNDRPFTCEQCDKKFTRSDHLAKHLRVHQKRQGLGGSKGLAKSSLHLAATSSAAAELFDMHSASAPASAYHTDDEDMEDAEHDAGRRRRKPSTARLGTLLQRQLMRLQSASSSAGADDSGSPASPEASPSSE